MQQTFFITFVHYIGSYLWCYKHWSCIRGRQTFYLWWAKKVSYLVLIIIYQVFEVLFSCDKACSKALYIIKKLKKKVSL